jgi:cell division protein FtsW
MIRNPPDLWLLLALIALVAFGLLMIMSASSVLGVDLHGDPYFFAKHQLLYGVVPGFLGLFLVASIPYHVWRRAVVPLLIVVLLLLLLVFIPAFQLSYGGASRWVRLGPVSVQPAEFAKLAVILYLAALFASRERMHGSVRKALIPFLIVVGFVGVLIAQQPDIGTLTVVAGAALLTYFAAGARLRHLAAVIASAVAVFVILIRLAPYRLARFTTFLHPELDPKGIGYQVHQALLAIGSGGFWGLGFGRSRQKFRYLPEPAGDSIFSIAAEELGFLRVAVLIALYTFIIIRGYQIARKAPDTFGKLVAVGITSWFFVQAAIHIGANLALTPLTGIPLPFVSYGGSALVIALAGAGILLNISRQSKA